MSQSENHDDDTATEQEGEYEYRVFGCTLGGWRATEWGSRERAVEIHEKCDWSIRSIERRAPGDDKTLQRKPTPSEDEWMQVTDDMSHIADEEVAEADE